MIANKKVPYILFGLTILSTLLTGWLHAVGFYLPNTAAADLLSTLRQPAVVWTAIAFSILLMTILTLHELGHYCTARRYGMEATLPLFIPGPPQILSGTFGAVIIIRSPFPDRRPLLELGANGPIAGFLASIPVLILGLSLSRVVPPSAADTGIAMGEPLLMTLLTRLLFPDLPPQSQLLAHPLALAGWFGLIVTAMNLLPVGQLDGGHVLYAIFGTRAHLISLIVIIVLVLLGTFAWPGWLLWALILTLIGYRHPPVPDLAPLQRKHRWTAAFCLLIFILTFTPVPLQIQL